MRIRPSPAFPAATLLFVLLLAAGCSTTSGDSYSASVAGDAAAARVAAARKAAEEQGGSAPPPAPRPSPDSSASGSSLGLSVTIDLSGRVALHGLAPGAILRLDGTVVTGEVLTASPGIHGLRAEAFGYEPWSGRVSVQPFGWSEVYIDMPRAVFGVGELAVAPDRVDPANPGSFGGAAISFGASAPGEASLSLLGPEGRRIWSVEGLSIEGSRTSLSWGGRTEAGAAPPPGDYLLRLEARGEDGTEGSAETLIAVGPGEPLRFSSLHAGFSGALFAPDARVLPGGLMQGAAGGYGVFEARGGPLAGRLPLWTGIRLGGLFGGRGELAASFMGVPYLGYTELAYDPSWISLAASLKLALARGNPALALLLGGSWGSFASAELAGTPYSSDGQTRFPALGAGLVGEVGGGGARLFGSASLEASTWFSGWATSSFPVPAFYAWARGRVGVETLFARTAAGELGLVLSAALRTEPLGAGFALADPLSLGAELHWYAADSGLVLSAYAAGEYESRGSWYLGGGFGLGFVLR